MSLKGRVCMLKVSCRGNASRFSKIVFSVFLVGMGFAPSAVADTVTIVLTNGALPEGNGSFDIFSRPSLNGTGQVAFWANLKNTSGGPGGGSDGSGIYLHNGSTLLNRARDSASVPEGNGSFSSFGQSPVLNSAGQVVFSALARYVSGGLAHDTGIYKHDGSALANLARTNTGVPEGNGWFNSFDNPLQLNSSGQVAFVAFVSTISGGTADVAGIYLHDGSALVNRVRTNTSVPEGNGTFGSLAVTPVLNNSAQLAFWAALANTSGGTTDDSGIYFHNGSALVNRARENAGVPEGNGSFNSFGRLPSLNDLGHVAFMANLKNTSGGTADDGGIYLHNGSTLLNRARENTGVPEGNGSFSSLGSPILNSAGQVAFSADLKSTSGGTLDDSGIYLHNGTGVVNLARENADVPEGDGSFRLFRDLTLNGLGQVVFSAVLRNTSGLATINDSIYLADDIEQLKVIRSGDALAGKTVSDASIASGSGGEDGKRTPLNDFGQVAYQAIFTDDTQGIFLFTPDLHWRGTENDHQWGSRRNFTLSTTPAHVHRVILDPVSNQVIDGPSTGTTIKSLQIGGGAGSARLSLQPGVTLGVTDGVTVANNGILSGSGMVNGSVTVNSGGTLAPGNSVGTIHAGSLSIGSGATLSVEIDLSAGTSDVADVSGTVDITGSLLQFTLFGITSGPLVPGQTYLLIKNDGIDGVIGTFGDFQPHFANTEFGIDYAFSGTALNGTGDGNDVAITITSVPEPTASVLAGIGLIHCLRRRHPR